MLNEFFAYIYLPPQFSYWKNKERKTITVKKINRTLSKYMLV